jgi:lambda family phage portal protein
VKLPKPNFFERALAAVAPKAAATSYLGRTGFYNIGQYTGARHERTSMKNWNPFAGSADADTIGDLTTLRSRSRDLTRNAGIARGALRTSRVNIVGSGLKLKPQINRTVLGIADAAAETWEENVGSLFDIWASSKLADLTQTQNFYEMQALAFTSTFESGDVFALRRYKERGGFLGLAIQLLEADRVCTPYAKQADFHYRDGVEIDDDGTPVAYHVLNRHPGDAIVNGAFFTPADWTRVSAEGEGGDALILHLFDKERVGQSRGVPSLAPVIEDLKQLDRYAEAELMAAVVSAFFTVFIKNQNGSPNDIIGESLHDPNHLGPASIPSNQVALGSGSVVELGAGESIETANPARPNANFDPFFLAIIRKIGISLGIPYEVLIMHFSSSYSASRAALEVAWQFFMDRRVWLARNFCQPTYAWFLSESIARGVIKAPGFFEDPILRAAWCGSEWIGPARIVLDPLKEANAEQAWMDSGVKTLEQVTINQTGGNWKHNTKQRGVERRERIKENLEPAEPPGTESSTGRPLQSGGAAAPAGGAPKKDTKK